ncbi:PilW family protein [Halalkalibacter akibai]|uniref:Prepilin-type N-terminal cleavage/methylation domain-containing protein n=1 Tax=Halalkalibacter akibai (strain ATCC 43226 / DSM 21942 / CIP 109018 / JCM 9157 / 1139) TaxID=1236973 RepID=W4QS90_HALA3|nr:type II secretion system protein [Halalkalibacter akibai]GAE34946.1 hypothetical protein JCM9157_2031 [Halalkalibacter akibai JCM 9157]
MKMANERGITLVELLVVITIMGVITAAVTGLVSYSLKTEKVVSGQNDVQREARFIMEHMTEKMRDTAYWFEDTGTGNWTLEKDGTVFLTYVNSDKKITLGEQTGSVLSDSVTKFEVKENEADRNEVDVILEITKPNGKIKLESTIIYSRF